MTGKSSKASFWFGMHLYCSVDLKLRMEDDIYLSSVTVNLLIFLLSFCTFTGEEV